MEKHIIHGFVMILIAVAYTLILTKALPDPACKEDDMEYYDNHKI